MKYNFSFYLILLLTLILPLFSTDINTIKQFYFGNNYTKSNNDETSYGDNTCQCDISYSCDYLCCCDEDCPVEFRDIWDKYSKCLDEKDTLGIFADRCIDKNLVVFNNKRRGLNSEYQTEDISGISQTIDNYCYSIDNSGKMKKDILSINELEKIGFKKMDNNTFSEISRMYIKEDCKKRGFNCDKSEQQRLRYLNGTDDIGNEVINNDDAKNIYINYNNSNATYFQRSGGYFSLYSGSNCQASKNIEIWKSENYSCSMDKAMNINQNILDDINLSYKNKKGNQTIINTNKCFINYIYFINDTTGLFNYSKFSNSSNICNNKKILEVEFLIQMEKWESKINQCLINFVCSSNNQTDKNYIFKNSIIFSQNEKIPYRYSGNGGYLNNFPLKIFDKDNKINNEYYVVGRDKSGNCRLDNDIYNYLYNYDKPLYFNQDYSYLCNLGSSKIEDTTLFKKINNIYKIAKYGSSSYKNILKNQKDWLNATNSLNTNFNHIIMKIYIGKKKTGLYSHKYIYQVNLTSMNDTNNGALLFDVKYYNIEDDENNEKKYNKIRSIPWFIPKIPDDLLDPLIYSDVDK